MTTPLEDAFPVGNTDRATLLLNLASQNIYVTDDLNAVTSEDFSIQPYPAICNQADLSLFAYDPNDTTSLHDGVSVVVVSGRRYKLKTQLALDYHVMSVGDVSPPSSPALGDQYAIGVAPTGDWASNAKNLALWTHRGWVFKAPRQGEIIWDAATSQFFHYAATNLWTAGLGIGALPNNSLTPLKSRHPLALLPITGLQNDPPVSMPGDGAAYIVGTTPTGDWAGNASAVAYVDGGAYTFIAAFEGATVYNVAAQALYSYKSGVWVPSIPNPAVTNIKRLSIDDRTNFDDNSNQVILASVSTSGNQGSYWRISILEYQFFLDIDSNDSSTDRTVQIQLVLDNSTAIEAVLEQQENIGTSAVAYSGKNLMFEIEIPDALEHSIDIRGKITAGSGGDLECLDRILTIYVEEVTLS